MRSCVEIQGREQDISYLPSLLLQDQVGELLKVMTLPGKTIKELQLIEWEVRDGKEITLQEYIERIRGYK